MTNHVVSDEIAAIVEALPLCELTSIDGRQPSASTKSAFERGAFAQRQASVKAIRSHFSSKPDHADAGKVEGDWWLPIESAPKDGRVLAVATGEIERISWNDPAAVVTVKAFGGPFVCHVHENGAGFTDEFGEVYRADGVVIDAEDLTAADDVLRLTHWRPLPTPPSGEVA